MDVNSVYFSQRLDKNISKKLSSKKRLGQSKGGTSSSSSNDGKRRSSTIFKEFFKVNSATTASENEVLKETIYNGPAASKSSETSQESPVESFSEPNEKEDNIYLDDTLICSKTRSKPQATKSDNIYLDDTLICPKTKSKPQVTKSDNIYLDETVILSVDKEKEQTENKTTATKTECSEDAKWNGLTNLKRCPLCLKKFDKLVPHVKSCASKYNVTTEQLFKAIDLQLKQNEERSALGLSSQIEKAPPAPRRKTSSSKGAKDANLELALALSLSLQESKINHMMKETDALIEIGLEDEALEQRKALEKFNEAKTSNQNVPKTAKISTERRKLQSKLLSRTKEERERIITEKVAIILMENDGLLNLEGEPQKTIKSKVLSKYQNKSKSFWQLAREDVDSTDKFYVQNLSECVKPCTEDIYTRLKLKKPVTEFNSPIKSDFSLEAIFQPGGSSSTATEVKVSPTKSINTTFENIISRKEDNCDKKIESKALENFSLLKDLSENWRSILYKRTLSDVKIVSREEKEIPAHKIVLFIRCPSILEDLITETDARTNLESFILIWNEFCFESIRLFLEYLYCAQVDLSQMENENLKSDLFNLAEKYDVNTLVQYIQQMDSNSRKNCDSKTDSFNFTTVRKDSPKLQPKKTLNFESFSNIEELKLYSNVNPEQENKLESLEGIKVVDERRDGSLSPDMFQCMEENTSLNNSFFQNSQSPNGSFLDNNPDNLKHLVESIQKLNEQENLINEDETQFIPKIDFPSCSKNLTDKASSVKTVLSEEHFNSTSQEKAIKPCMEENTGSTYYECNSEDLEFMECKNCSEEENNSSLNSTARKRKSSVQSALEDTKKPCIESAKIVMSVDLTQSSNSNLTPVFPENEEGSETLSLPDPKPCDKKALDKPENLGCGDDDSTRSLPNNSQNENRFSESQESVLEGSETRSLPDLSKRHDNSLENSFPKDANQETNYGYISPFWDNFEDGCAGFSACPDPASKSESEDFTAKSPLTDETIKTVKSSPLPNYEEDTNCKEPLFCNSSPEVILSPIKSTPKKRSMIIAADLSNLNVADGSISETALTPKYSPLQPRLSSPYEACGSNSTEGRRKFDELVINKEVAKTPPKNRQSGSQHFVNDSLFENETFLSQIETDKYQGQVTKSMEEAIRTPSPNVQNGCGVTPMLDYSGMKTVQIKNELNKYGLKTSLGKKKGKILLKHIYNELHPTVPAISSPIKSTADVPGGNGSNKMSGSRSSNSDVESEEEDISGENEFECSFSSEGSSVLEESFMDLPVETLTQTSGAKYLKKDELESRVVEFIKQDKCLHTKILMYEPIWLQKLQEDLKKIGVKCKLADLMDVLDEKCITFRTVNSRGRKKRRRCRRTKSTLSQRTPKKPGRPRKNQELLCASD